MDIGLRPFAASDADWLVSQHVDHYGRVEGFDDSLGPLVASIIQDFLKDHDPGAEAGWMAHAGDRRLGTIFCVKLEDQLAKLRLFYLIPEARGTGVAQRLLSSCLQFARDSGYRGLTLWTHESHKAAGAIYVRNGLIRTKAKPVHSFGVDLIEETWKIAF